MGVLLVPGVFMLPGFPVVAGAPVVVPGVPVCVPGAVLVVPVVPVLPPVVCAAATPRASDITTNVVSRCLFILGLLEISISENHIFGFSF
jgi:hypothetical protein